MKIKQEGIIKQIIPGDKAKQYGFYRDNNCDYLNIRPMEEREIPIIFNWMFYGLITGLLLIGLFVEPGTMGVLMIIIWIICFFVYAKLKEKSRNLPKRDWYFNSPVPVEKLYDFKQNDKVNIIIYIEKEE